MGKKLVLRNSNHQNDIVSYFVDEENKTVSCTMTCYVDSRSIPSTDGSNFILDSIIRSLGVDKCKIEKTAQVKCKPGDEFDIEFGKTLAYSRAKTKCLTSMIKFIEGLKANILNTVTDLEGEMDRYLTASKAQFKDSNKLVEKRFDSK